MKKGAKNRKLGILIDDRTVRIADLAVSGKEAALEAARSFVSPSGDDAAMAATLTRAVQELGCAGLPACLAVSDRSMPFELAALPRMKPADRKKVVERNAVRILHAGREGAGQIQYAFRFTREVQKPEGRMEEHLIQGTSHATVQRYLGLCDRANVEVESLVSLPEALFGALKGMRPAEPNEALLVVDFENSFTHVVLLAASGWLFSRDLAKTIDPGQMASARSLQLGAETAPAEGPAEGGEEGSGAAPSERSAGLPPLLLGEIRRTILFVEREFSLKVAKVVFCGALRPEGPVLEELAMKVEKPAFFPESSTAYAAAIGAVLASADPSGLNLLPTALRPQSGFGWKRTTGLAACLAVLVGVAVLCANTLAEIPKLEKLIRLADPLVKRALQDENRPKEDPAQVAEMSTRLTALAALRQNRSPVLYVLQEVGRSAPADLALENLKLFRHGSRWVFRCGGSVKGGSPNEAFSSFEKFYRALKQSPLFDQVEYQPFGNDPSQANAAREARFDVWAYLKGVSG